MSPPRKKNKGPADVDDDPIIDDSHSELESLAKYIESDSPPATIVASLSPAGTCEQQKAFDSASPFPSGNLANMSASPPRKPGNTQKR